ncbi:hypothetical protein MKW94_025136 [Papaver nudicaule]|uniref:WRKY domain-containing protein n=1 Tax=Papaver nudicaule TaxID=74823 RepID=A0AA41VJ62_PAPNU|nr:hypothetical protein [Papaver nudicaule]
MSSFIEMEKNNTSKLILNELAQAKELLKQLESDLYAPSCTNGKLLIPQILSYFENSLSMLNGVKPDAGNQSQVTTGSETASTGTDSPRSVNGSPRRDYESDLMGSPSKKRKTTPRWTERLRVCEQTGLEGPIEDGYSWRKYGQKDILGAIYPRGYYRCTHRTAQGCSAMKQVQRSDEDPSMFTVTYRGRHTCVQAPHLLPGQSLNRHCQQDQKPEKSGGTMFNFQTGRLGDETEVSGETPAVLRSPSFSFPSLPLPIPSIEKESNKNIFSSMTPDNHFKTGHLSSPATSGTNSFSTFSESSFEGGQNLQTSESNDFFEYTSALDSQDLYLDLDFVDFDFQFDM